MRWRAATRVLMMAVLISVLLRSTAWAADSYWTNAAGGSFGTAGNWIGGVPGAVDNANFTNNAAALYPVYLDSASPINANAFFNNGTNASAQVQVSLWYGFNWTITNSLVIGQGVGSAGSVSQPLAGTPGSLLVTNSAGTATMIIGQSGAGTYQLNGTTLVVDQLFATNGLNSVFTFNSGTLNTLHGSTINRDFTIGTGFAAATANWNILGGTNITGNPAGATTYIGDSGGGNNMGIVTVSGPATVWTNRGQLWMGAYAGNNQLVVTNGAKVYNGSVAEIGVFFNACSNNTIIVTGSNSLWSSADYIRIGAAGWGNALTIANGGQVLVASRASILGDQAGSSNNTVLVTGSNSLWSSAAGITVGGGGSNNVLTIQNGGEARSGGDTIIGRDTTSAGNLILISGGTLTVTNAATSLDVRRGALVLSSGTVNVNQLLMTNGASGVFSASGGNLIAQTATIGSSFSLTNSTGIFSNLTVTSSGSLSGTGGIFVLSRDFINQSTNRTQFNLSRSTLFFTNGVGTTVHTLNLTNSGAVDMGSNWLNVTQLATNFSIGTLSIALSNNVTLTGMKSGATTNALYVGWLNLTAWNTNAAVLSATLSNALTLPNINLYYDASDTRNAYLQDASYALWGGGGLLIPIPEPSTAGLILGGALLSVWFLRRREE